jgi:hypothetical protein
VLEQTVHRVRSIGPLELLASTSHSIVGRTPSPARCPAMMQPSSKAQRSCCLAVDLLAER